MILRHRQRRIYMLLVPNGIAAAEPEICHNQRSARHLSGRFSHSIPLSSQQCCECQQNLLTESLLGLSLP